MTTADRVQLAKLAQRIPDQFVEQVRGQGGPQDYIAHHVINQFLLYVLGPFSLELVQVHRGDVLDRTDGKFIEGKSAVTLSGVIVGATYRLRATVDGEAIAIEATGDVEHPTNWQHDGARLKDAESDALKRAAMRLGLGLELWAKEHYVLDKWIPVQKDKGAETSGADRGGSAPDTTSEPEAPPQGKDGQASGSDPPAEPKQRPTSRARTSKTKQDAPAEPAAPQAPPAEDAPAVASPSPPGAAAAGATSPNGHPADQAQTMEQVAAALGRSLNNCWIRLRRAAQQGELPAKPFAELATADQLKQLGGDDLKLGRAWLIDHNRGAAA